MKIFKTATMVLALAILGACGGSKGDSDDSGGGSSSEAVKNETPKAAYTAAVEAIKEGDFSAFSQQLTPEAQEQFTGMMVGMAVMMEGMGEMMGGMAEAIGGEEASEKTKEAVGEEFKSFKEILTQHKINKERFLAVNGEDSSELDKMKAMGAMVEDRDSFLRDLSATLSNSKGFTAEDKSPGDLGEVTIDGDTATAQAVGKDGKVENLSFRRIDGSWFMELPESMKK